MEQSVAIRSGGETGLAAAYNAVSGRALVLMTVLGGATALMIVVVAQSGLDLRLSEFLPFVAIAAALFLLSAYCVYRKMDQRLADAALFVALGTLSLLLCGLISNVGLRLRAPTIDAALAQADAILGWDVSRTVPAFANYPTVIDALALAYNLSGALVAGGIFVALVAGRTAKAWELLVTTIISMQVIAAISILAPARGAMAYFNLLDLQGDGLPRGAGIYHLKAFDYLHTGTETSFGIAQMSGLVTFPSFHTVLALLISQAVADTRFKFFGLGICATTIVSTIPIGGHYVIDIVAGTLIWLGAAVIATRVDTRHGAVTL